MVQVGGVEGGLWPLVRAGADADGALGKCSAGVLVKGENRAGADLDCAVVELGTATGVPGNSGAALGGTVSTV